MFPITATLGVRRYAGTGRDSHGNPVTSYDEPVDWPVYGYAPGASEEPHDPNRDLSVVLWTVYAPVGGNAPTERDLVVLPDGEYEVEGRPADWSHGPVVIPGAGVVVELKRAEG